MLYYSNLEEIIFNKHELLDVDELLVLSGYIGPQPVSRLRELPIKSSVIYGMYGAEKISERLHNSLLNLNNEIDSTSVFYSNIPIHSKCYVWLKNNNIISALIGSANFSVSGLSNPYKEVLADATIDTFYPLKEYLRYIKENSINCNDSTVEVRKRQTSCQTTAIEENLNGICRATLIDEHTGEVPERSGINWGLSPGHVTLGDAYIPIHKKYILQYPNLFPPKQFQAVAPNQGRRSRQNDAVEYIWDDGTVMEGLLEQTQTVGNIAYPKAMCSSPQKNVLGIYLRERLGVDIDHRITREDLERYGRTDISISLQGEGIYFLDFSVR